jgi:Small-conductance mechanosensitive channel
MEQRGLDAHARKPLQKITSVAVVFAAIAVAFGAAGFGNFLTALATIGAAATLAIGFAMQDIIKNFVSGVFIFTDKPFRIGDWIQWDGHSGIVEDVSLRVTRVRTFDNELLTVPNSDLTENVVKNPVAKDQLRLKFVFGIGYDDDIDTATEIILEEAENHEDIMDDPGPSVRLVELGDSSVGLQSRIWIDNPGRSDFVKIRGEYVQTSNSTSTKRTSTSPIRTAPSRAASNSKTSRVSSNRRRTSERGLPWPLVRVAVYLACHAAQIGRSLAEPQPLRECRRGDQHVHRENYDHHEDGGVTR